MPSFPTQVRSLIVCIVQSPAIHEISLSRFDPTGDRIVAYGDHLEAGVYSLHYLVRPVTPGEFIWPGASVTLQYAPEEFGRSASSTLVVSTQ